MKGARGRGNEQAFSGLMVEGSTQHSSLAHGLVLTMSGGSVAMFKQITKAAAWVLRRDLSRQSSEGEDEEEERDLGLPPVRCRLVVQ